MAAATGTQEQLAHGSDGPHMATNECQVGATGGGGAGGGAKGVNQHPVPTPVMLLGKGRSQLSRHGLRARNVIGLRRLLIFFFHFYAILPSSG